MKDAINIDLFEFERKMFVEGIMKYGLPSKPDINSLRDLFNKISSIIFPRGAMLLKENSYFEFMKVIFTYAEELAESSSDVKKHPSRLLAGVSPVEFAK